MKQYLYRILSFVFAISILLTTFLYCPISAYATYGGGGGINHDKDAWIMKDSNTINVDDDGKIMYYIEYILSQCGAIVKDHNLSQAMSNDQTMKSYIANGYYDSDKDTIVFPQETVNYIYNTFKSTVRDTDPYYIAFTYPMNRLNFSAFGNQKNVYDTVNNLLADSRGGFIKIALHHSYFGTSIVFSEFDDITDTGFVKIMNYGDVYASAYRYSTWKNSIETKYRIILTPDDPAIETISEFKENASETRTYTNSSSIDMYAVKVCDETMKQTDGSNALFGGSGIGAWMHIVTPTRRSIRVFHSFDDLADYSISNRKVYFTSDYYDYVPSDITVPLDEMIDTVDKLDDVLDKLLDKIDDSTDEDAIEKLLQQILDEMKNGGGDDDNKGNGNNGGSSYDDTGLLSLLSGYFNSVLAYLDGILEAIEALVWIEVDDSISEDQKDLFDLIDKIWQDPENGSQEAADAISGSFSDVARGLTKKFPFSIPWDIHALFTVFANAGNPEPAVMSYSAEPALLYSDSGGIQTYAGDSGIITQEDHNAPYFVLPLVIESWGINEQVEIDLKDFQTLSTLSRTLFSLLFAVFLIKFTISVIKIYKGGSDD